jgi:AI-2 transport protein TqsA
LTPEAGSPRSDMSSLGVIALCLVIAATSWFLLQQLAVLLRPLFMAVFLAYIILPLHQRLTLRVHHYLSFVVLAGASMAVLYGLSLLVYSSAVELSEDLPRYTRRIEQAYERVSVFWNQHFSWFSSADGQAGRDSEPERQRLRDIGTWIVNTATEALAEALVVEILRVAERINAAIASYVKAKVQASLILAAPVTLVLWACGVRFPLMWGTLTFLCNFIPYLGSVAAVSLPLAFAFLDLDLQWRFFAASACVLATHLIMTYLVEPTITSKAVGLSPLVILFSLAFWGQCWGFIGLFLAVPLTVMLKIVLENIAETRPIASLLGDK